MRCLHVPQLDPDVDVLTAALAYAAAGWYVLPIRRGTKNPGSVVGDGWQLQSSRDPEQIAAWFVGTSHGVALHLGRSGALAADVDHPDRLPEVLVRAGAETLPPVQSSRVDQPGRVHLLFAQPPGRMLGNGTGRLGGSWGEIRGRNGVVVVAPSVHEFADQGGRYAWTRAGAVPVLPAAVADLLDDSVTAEDAASDEQVEAFLDRYTGTARPELLDVWCHLYAKKVRAGESRHERMISVLAGAMKEAAAGFFDARIGAARLEFLFLDAVARNPISDEQNPARTGAKARSEWAGILAWAVGQAEAADLDKVRARVADKVPDPLESENSTTETITVNEVVVAVRQLHHVVDTGPIKFALAVSVSSVLDQEPLWGMHVGAPSSGKTVTQELLGDVADDQVDELTVAGLLTWSKGGKRGVPARPVGLLARIGQRGFATIGDFSTVLAGSDHNGRDQLFGNLRRVYDGSFTRNMDSPDGEPLRWSGRLTLLAAVTPVIDSYTTHSDALGPRWLYIRTDAATTEDKRAAAHKARRRHEAADQRKVIRAAASALVDQGRRVMADVDLSDDAHDALDDAALVGCWGRASVPRQSWGRREVDGVAVIEEPPRLVRQLVTLTRCLVAIGEDEADAVDLARRCALDTVPAARRDCLQHLAAGVEATVSEVARHTRHHRDVIRRALEDMQIVGLTTCPVREEAEVDQDSPITRTTPAPWSLHGADGALVSLVLQAHSRAQKRAGDLPQERGSTPPLPPHKGGSAHEEPTFRGKPHPVGDHPDLTS